MTEGTPAEQRLAKAERRLRLTMQLSHSSFWEFVLTDGLVENSYLDEGAVYWEEGRGAPAGSDFGSSLAALGVLPEDRLSLTQAIQACVDGKTPEFHCDVRWRQRDGEVRWRQARGTVSRDPDGTPRSFTGIGTDITELKRAEEEARRSREQLRESEERLRAMFENAAVSMVVTDLEGQLLDYNDRFCEFLGYSRAELKRSFRELLVPDEVDLDIEQQRLVVSGRVARFSRDMRYFRKDGSVAWGNVSTAVIERDSAGKPARIMRVIQDITKRKSLEDSLKESEYRWRSLAETLPLLVFTAAADGTIEYLGTQATEYTGRAEQEMLGSGWAASIHPDDLERTGKSWFEAIEKQHIHEVQHRIRRADGEYGWFTTRAAPARDSSGRVFKWVGTCTDITTLKQLEETLQRTKDRLELAVFSSNLSIFEFELPDGRLSNSRHSLLNFWQQLGYDPETVPQSFAEAAHFVLTEQDLVRVPTAMQAYLDGEIPRFELEHQVRHRDGSLQWRLARGMAVRDEHGIAVRFIGSHVDITDRKRVEEKLRDSEERWRTLVDTVPHLVFTTRPDGEVDHFSAQTLAFLGRPESELLGSDWLEAIHPCDRKYVMTEWSKSIEQPRMHETHHRVRRADGEYRWMTTRVTPLLDDTGRALKWFGISTDITAMKQLEAELRHAKDLLELGVRGSKVSIFDFDMPDGEVERARQTTVNLWESLGYDPATAPTQFGPGSELAIHPDDLGRFRSEVQAYLSGSRQDFEIEFRVRHKDGTVLWHLARGVAHRDAQGKPVRFIGSFVDITDKKRAEERQRESERGWKNLAESLPLLVWTMKPDGVGDYYSLQAQEFTGLTETEFIEGWLRIIHPDDHAATIEAWSKALAAESLYTVDFRVRRVDGVYRWFTSRAVPLRDDTGRVFKWVGTCTDIEERKQLAENLRESERRWQTLAEMVPHLVWSASADGAVDYYNAQATEYTGLPESQLHGFSWTQALHPEDREYTIRAWLEALEQQRPHNVEHRVRGRDGSYQWFSTRAVPILDGAGRTLRWFGTNTNVEGFKRLEAELRHAKELLELGVRGSKVSIFDFDMPDGEVERARQTMVNLWESLGHDPATAPTQFGPGSELAIHPDDLGRFRSEVEAYLAGTRQDFEIEFRVRHQNGTVLWHLARGLAYRDTQGKPLRFIGSFVDITDKKQVEERHRESEQRWRTLSESLPLLVWTTNTDGIGEYYSVQTQEFTGLTELELIEGWLKIIHPDDHAPTLEAWAKALAAETVYNVDFRVRRTDGVYRWFTSRAVPLRDDAGRVFKWVGTCTDIEERKQLAENLRESERRWQELAEMVPHFVWTASADGELDYFSAQATAYTGIRESELHGSGWGQTLHPEDLERTVKSWLEALEQQRPLSVEHRLRRHDGTYQWFLTRAVPILDGAGRTSRWFGTNTNVEDFKRLEEELRASEQRWQHLAEMVPQQVWTATAEGSVDYYNARATENTGIPESGLHGSGWTQVIHPDDLEPTVAAWVKISAQPAAFESEHRVRQRDGEYQWFVTRAAPIFDSAGQVVKWFGTDTNVDSFKRLEAELRHAKDLLEVGVRGSKVSIFEFDMPDGELENAQQTMVNLWESLGHDPATAPKRFGPGSELAIHPDDLAWVRSEVLSYLNGERADFEIEFRVRHSGGAVLWHLARGVAHRNVDGKVRRFIGSFVDITDKKQIEERLRASEQRWRSHAESLPQFVFTTTPDGSVDYFSAKTSAYTGVAQSDLLGVAWGEAIHPDDILRTVQTWNENRTNRRPHQVEHRIRRADGVYRWFTTRADAVRGDDGEIVAWFGTCTDIENMKQLEAELRHARDLLELGVRGSKVSIFEFDMPNGDMQTARPTMINLWESLGYDPATAPTNFGLGFELLIHPDDLDRVRLEVANYLNGGHQDFEIEFRVRHKDGTVLWHLARGVAYRDAEGKPRRFIGSFVDITDKKQVEERLRASEQRWRSHAESLPQFVFTMTPEGMADYFSATTSAYTGISQSDLLGAAWLVAIHPDDMERTAQTWEENRVNRRAHQVEHRIRRADGVYRWFTTRAAAVWDGEGNIVAWFGTCTDVENLKQLEADLRHAKERLELAIRSANLCIWEYDMPDGTLESSRETLTNVWESFGYDLLDPPPSVASVIHPDDLDGVGQQIMACLSGQTPAFESEHRVRHHDGSYHWILGRGVALRDSEGRPTRFVGTSIDINAIKRIEADLLRAREAAESANRAKDEFLANVSHEIRTPMNAILGMTELALDSARSEHQKQLLATVRSAARNLLNIINDLLDFSKIAAGKLALDELDFSLRAAMADVVRALAPRAQRKGLELICDVHADAPDALFGDVGRLRQVLMNLIGNALKFTAQGEVVVRVTRLPNPANVDTVFLRFTVRDTGIGIARDKQVAIFRAFEQEDASTTRKFGGTGLGLTISSQLVALMGGEITVDSEPGRGSTFAFTANFARSSRPESSDLSASPELLEGLRVLVIDDNETNRRVLVERLSDWRMRPFAVGNATSAVEALARADQGGAPYSLVLLDARMPDIDGISLAAEIQGRFGSAAQRLILLSSDEDPVLPARSREAGIHGYLLKPVQQSELLETIWAVMNMPVDGLSGARSGTTREPRPAFGTRTALRILVAEDNELNVALLRELLSKAGHRAEFAGDGRAALGLLTANAYDLLLLDLHMPEMDGFEVVQAIREHELGTNRHLPIVALTARSSNRDRERCLAAGMDDFLSKPIEADALWAAIERVALAFLPSRPRPSRLLDHGAISRACGGRQSILEKLCAVFQRSLPEHMAKVRSALDARDLRGLSEAAHLLYGTVAAFSTIAGALALSLEGLAAAEDLESCTELVERLEPMCLELLEDARSLVNPP